MGRSNILYELKKDAKLAVCLMNPASAVAFRYRSAISENFNPQILGTALFRKKKYGIIKKHLSF